MSRDHLAREKQTLGYRSESDKGRERESSTAWTGCGEQRARGTDLRRCSTLELVPGQGQHPRVGVSLNVTCWASGLPHPIQTPRDRESSRQRKAETQTGKTDREHRETRWVERQRAWGRAAKRETQRRGHRPMVQTDVGTDSRQTGTLIPPLQRPDCFVSSGSMMDTSESTLEIPPLACRELEKVSASCH